VGFSRANRLVSKCYYYCGKNYLSERINCTKSGCNNTVKKKKKKKEKKRKKEKKKERRKKALFLHMLRSLGESRAVACSFSPDEAM